MQVEITPEIRAALEQHPVGPIRLVGESVSSPVYVIRLDDMANLQELMDKQIRTKLAEADEDIATERIEDWNPQSINQMGRERYDSRRNANS